MRPLLSTSLLVALVILVSAPPAAVAQTLAPTPAVPPTTNQTPTNGAVTTVAPTPNLVPERVAPAERAGNNTADPAGPVASTPFSAGPQGGTGGQISPALRGTESPGSPSTPELGR